MKSTFENPKSLKKANSELFNWFLKFSNELKYFEKIYY